MFRFLKDRKQFWLFWGAWIAFALLLIVKIKFDVPGAMKSWPRLISALQSDAFEDVVGDLLTGLVSAYFFYVVIDLIPRRRLERKTKEIMSKLLSSIVETFLHDRITAHAEPLGKFHELDSEEISQSRLLLEGKPDSRQFLSLTFIAKWGYPKFLNSLQLAVSLGVDHAAVWMNVTDCVARLKDHGERADRTGLLGNMVDIINLLDKPEFDESVENEVFMWQLVVRDDMKKPLDLAEELQSICQ
ncbi:MULTISPECIES: hypothetical protein [Pseudomonas]|uniref:Uncharacterized protein n=2 Tax=Pseudomonas fragariae (ex Marin et al. 2024) TaxID=3080056 RepID=A0ABT3LEK5_9PSED|nr:MULTISPECIES: hypothetical protein [Pseudomonas]MCW6054891.1 hypothetical protein [Pseudomonas fragi]MCF5201031.1 hypothetical protein [Pseudomonas syringae]MCF5208989.1 hypothetical protein [Pseudomonas syringae]MCF5214012.1 hypothetical protein [Pseudomonas syringae]MCF5221554.1 hypothetical protein [Pseudomonas syringae]